LKSVVVEVFNLIFGNGSETEKWWKVSLPIYLMMKYGPYGLDPSFIDESFDWFKRPKLLVLVLFQDSTGLVLSKEIEQTIALQYHLARPLTTNDILEIRERVKHVDSRFSVWSLIASEQKDPIKYCELLKQIFTEGSQEYVCQCFLTSWNSQDNMLTLKFLMQGLSSMLVLKEIGLDILIVCLYMIMKILVRLNILPAAMMLYKNQIAVSEQLYHSDQNHNNFGYLPLGLTILWEEAADLFDKVDPALAADYRNRAVQWRDFHNISSERRAPPLINLAVRVLNAHVAVGVFTQINEQHKQMLGGLLAVLTQVSVK